MTASSSDLQQYLRELGFGAIRAELWAEFVEHVLAVFRDACDLLQQDDNWRAFTQKRGALSRPRKSRRTQADESRPLEDALTSELAHFMRRIRRGAPQGHFLRLHEVTFQAEDLVSSTDRAGRHSKRIDFFVYCASGPDEPELAIEAKPLHSISDINNRYLAQEGIGCFFSADSPYSSGPLGGMLAYTVNAEKKSWRVEIRAAVVAYTPSPLSVDDLAVKGHPEVLTWSRHSRSDIGLDAIAMLHFEMIFAPIESDQGA